MHSAASICEIHILVPICFSDNWLMRVDRPLEYLSKRQGNLHLFEKGRGRQREKGNRDPIRDIFCFGGKYVVLWGLRGVSVAIRLFKASQWECGRARLSPLPCPPTGTDGHPRSSLISLQSGNDPCSWDVAALFKYDARCSPTFSMSSHCPRKPGGERGKERESATSHNAACVVGCCAYCVVLILLFLACVLLSVFRSSCSLTPSWEGDAAWDLRWPPTLKSDALQDWLNPNIPQTYSRMLQWRARTHICQCCLLEITLWWQT